MSIVLRYKKCVEKLTEANTKNSININTDYDSEESISKEALFGLIYESNKLLQISIKEALNDCIEIVGSANDSGDLYRKVFMDFKDSEGKNIFINTEIVLKGYDLVQKTSTLDFQIGKYLITVNANGYKVEEPVNASNSSTDDYGQFNNSSTDDHGQFNNSSTDDHGQFNNSTIHGDL